MPLNGMYEYVKSLDDNDLAILLRSLEQEKERRDDAEWRVLCRTIENFIGKQGSIAIYEKDDYMTNVIVHLRRGEFTFPDFGEIEVS